MKIKYGDLKGRMKNNKNLLPKFWLSKNKDRISCKEKVKILNSNFHDFKNLLEETYDEALLMGVDPKQIKTVLNGLLKNIDSSLDSEK